MSFLYDPPLLVAAGVAIEQLPVDDETRGMLGTATSACFIGGSSILWLDTPGLRWFWRPFGAASGRDFMITSGLGKRRVTKVGVAGHLLAAAALSTYPLWVAAGRRLGRRLRQSRTA